MSTHEHGVTAFQFENASEKQIQEAFDLLEAAALPHATLTPNESLLNTVRAATATPFEKIEPITLATLDAEYDKETNTVYPQIVAVQLHGHYGEMMINERSLVYALAHDPVENTYQAFALQAFHDSESYPIEVEFSLIEFARTIAAETEKYQSGVEHEQPAMASGDYKRTAELRPLDGGDLDMMTTLILEARGS